MVPAHVDAHVIDGFPLRTDGQQGGGILVHLLAVTELIHSSYLAGLIDGRFVLHANLGLELILG